MVDIPLAPVEPVVAATSTETVVTAPEPTAEVTATLVPHTDTSSLLEEVKAPVIAEQPKEEAATTAPVEAAKTEEVPPVTSTEVPSLIADAIAPVKAEDLVIPEGLTILPEKMANFIEFAGKHNITKDAAQELLNLHTETLKQFAENSLAQQHQTFADTRKQWRDQVMADEQVGGSGHRTSMAAIARMRDMFVPQEQMEEFNNFLRITGAGDHPAFLKLLHNVARRFDEPGLPPTGAKPPPNMGQKPKSRVRDLYNKS